MSDDQLGLLTLFYAAVLVTYLIASRRARLKLADWFVAVYVRPARRLYVSALRRITGRLAPDYARIARLEREIG